jgi:hypothetical protein
MIVVISLQPKESSIFDPYLGVIVKYKTEALIEILKGKTRFIKLQN